jgi:urea transporter
MAFSLTITVVVACIFSVAVATCIAWVLLQPAVPELSIPLTPGAELAAWPFLDDSLIVCAQKRNTM